MTERAGTCLSFNQLGPPPWFCVSGHEHDTELETAQCDGRWADSCAETTTVEHGPVGPPRIEYSSTLTEEGNR